MLLSTGNESGRINISDSTPMDVPSGAVSVSQTLTIYDTVDGDSGDYSCMASNTIPGLSLDLNNTSSFEVVIQSKHLFSLSIWIFNWVPALWSGLHLTC